jgi:hypothetical protein
MSAERGWIGGPPPLVASALEGWIEQHRALGHQVVRVEPGDPRHTRSAESEGHCDCHGIWRILTVEQIGQKYAHMKYQKHRDCAPERCRYGGGTCLTHSGGRTQ